MRPYDELIHDLDLLSVEDALLRTFTKGSKHARIKRLARWLFHDTLQASIDVLHNDAILCNMTVYDMQHYLHGFPQLYDKRASTSTPVEDVSADAQGTHGPTGGASTEGTFGGGGDAGGAFGDEDVESDDAWLYRALEMQLEWNAAMEAQDNAYNNNNNDDDDDDMEAFETEMTHVDTTTFMGLKNATNASDTRWQHWPLPEELHVVLDVQLSQCAWLSTIWARINFGPLLVRYLERVTGAFSPFARAKIKLFSERHLPIVQWIHDELCKVPAAQRLNDAVMPAHIASRYVPLGHSSFPDDRSHITSHSQVVQRKRRPLDILTEALPDVEWNPWHVAHALRTHWSDDALWCVFGNHTSGADGVNGEGTSGGEDAPTMDVPEAYTLHYHPLQHRMNSVEVLRNHSLYLACCLVVSRCQTLEDVYLNENAIVYDALYMYRLAFLDLFYHCLSVTLQRNVALSMQRMDDVYLLTPQIHGAGAGLSPWERFYPHDTRAFHADDLPNLLRVMLHIPLAGIDRTPKVLIYHIFSKCMPFACMKRGLVDDIVDECVDEPMDAVLLQQQQQQHGRHRKAPYIRYCVNEGFWRLFRHIMWCMLAGTYPDARGRPGMRKLLRIKQLTENRDELIQALSLSPEEQRIRDRSDMSKSAQKKALKRLKTEQTANNNIIIAAFRAYYLHMVMDEPHYVMAASAHIDLQHLFRETHRTMTCIRRSNLFLKDAFQMARSELKDYNEVYRYHQSTCPRLILEHCNKDIENTLYEGVPIYKRTIAHLQRIQDALDTLLQRLENVQTPLNVTVDVSYRNALYDILCMSDGHEYSVTYMTFKKQMSRGNVSGVMVRMCAMNARDATALLLEEHQMALGALLAPLSKDVKSNILNLLLRVPSEERLSPMLFNALRFPQYGGICKYTASILQKLADMYQDRPMPNEIYTRLGRCDTQDLRVVAWTFNCLTRLDRIRFAPLDIDSIQQIHDAMLTKRFIFYPGQAIPNNIYDIYYALCCNKIRTLFERDQYGSRDMSFDMERQSFVCKKTVKKKRKNKHTPSLNNNVTHAANDTLGNADAATAAGGAFAEGTYAEGTFGGEDDDDDVESGGDDALDGGVEEDRDTFFKAVTGDAFDPEDVLRVIEKHASDAHMDPLTRIEHQLFDYEARDRNNESEKVLTKRKQDARSLFHAIPCDRQPVLPIPLRGAMLVMVGKERVTRITRCTRCACPHRYAYTRHQGDAYVCVTCAQTDICYPESGAVAIVRECAFCGAGGADGRIRGGATESTARRIFVAPHHVLQVVCPDVDPCDASFNPLLEPDRIIQTLRFCSKCYKIAEHHVHRKTKAQLWKTLEQKIRERTLSSGGMRVNRQHGQMRMQPHDTPDLAEDTQHRAERLLNSRTATFVANATK